MKQWFAANGATLVIALILLILVFFAARRVYKNKGGCGCGCKGGCEGCKRPFDSDLPEKKERG